MSDKKIIFVFLMLLVIPFVFAGSSFTFYSGADIGSVCPRSTGLYSDVIENNGDEILEFTVSSSGSAAVFATTVPTGFVLVPGQIKNIYTYITPMSSIDVGTYNLRLNANANGISHEINHNIVVMDCYDYSFVVNDVQKNVCPCDSEKFSFTLTNNGEYTEGYSLIVGGEYAGSVTLSQNTLTLTPGESKEIFAYAQSDCEDQGDYEFSVKVVPNKGKAVKSQTAKLIVDSCYNFDVNTDRDLINMCEHSAEVVAITVENGGSTANSYALKLDGPAWANLENNRLEIGPGASKTVNLDLVPDYGVEGNFQVSFSAVPNKGTVQALNVFNVNVKKCHDVSVKLEKDMDKICNSLENTYGVTVRNQGEFSKDFFVDLEGPAWAILDATSVSLGAGEEKQMTLSVTPTYDVVAGEYEIKVEVSAKDSNKIASSDSIKIQTVTREECYDASLNIEDNSVEVYYDSSATIPVVIENKGADVATYSLSVSGTATNFVYMNPSVIDVSPGESEIVYLYVAPSSQVNEGSYSVTVTVRLEDSTIMASESVNIKITGTPSEGDLITGDIVEDVPSESGESLFSKIVKWISNLFGGSSEEDSGMEDVTDEVTDEEDVTEGESVIDETEEIVEEEPVINETEEDIPEETPEDLETINSLLSVGETVNFVAGGEDHTIEVSAKGSTNVLLEINSDSIFVQLDVGDVKQVDVNGDGVEDIEVSFSGFVGNKADISYKLLAGSEIEVNDGIEDVTGDVTEEDTGEENSGFFAGFINSLGVIFTGLVDGIVAYQIQLIVLIIVIIIVVLLAKTSLWKKIIKFFEEEVEEESVAASKPIVEPKKEEKKVEPSKKEEKPKEEKKKPEEDEDDEFVIEFDDD